MCVLEAAPQVTRLVPIRVEAEAEVPQPGDVGGEREEDRDAERHRP
jgi:hypothetical protein